MNPAAEETFGYGRNEAAGQSLAELIVPEQSRELFHACLSGEPCRNIGMDLKRKDGTILPAELSFSPEMRSGAGSDKNHHHPRRHRAQASRGGRTKRGPVPDPESRAGPAYPPRRNPAVFESGGRDRPGAVAGRKRGVIPERVRQAVEAALNEGAPRDLEIRIAGRDFSFVVTPIVEGQYANLYGWDVTDRKRAEAALQESEERYRGLFESMNEGFALHELLYDESGEPCDYRFLDVNPAFERLTGLKRQDVVGKTVSRSPARHGALLDQALRRGRSHRHACPFREPLLGAGQGLRGFRLPARTGTVCGDLHGHHRARRGRGGPAQE